MGYNQTFEIIIKDIQDIEKLVGNFKNYSRVPKIELDLALSKLRNVYELMLMFHEEETSAAVHPHDSPRGNAIGTDEKPVQDSIPGQTPETGENQPSESEQRPEADEINKAEPIAEQKLKLPDAENMKAKEKILADQFEKTKAYINESLGEKTKKEDLSSRFQHQPIEKIAGSMGVNDKFFYIRELFNGDAEKFRSTMDILEHTSGFDQAVEYLKNNHDWDMKSSSVQQLLNLVRRKFIP